MAKSKIVKPTMPVAHSKDVREAILVIEQMDKNKLVSLKTITMIADGKAIAGASRRVKLKD